MSSVPKVIDLYSGVGGLSLGAARAGFEVVSAFEIDKMAISSHALNFPNSKHHQLDIGTLDGKRLLELSGLRAGELDGIIGGPPCQGFSAMGKNDPSDLRNDLFVQFFRLVAQARPRFFLAENVPGLMSPKYDAIRQIALGYVKDHYQLFGPFKIKASDYGAPTSRTRMFFVGIDTHQLPMQLETNDLSMSSGKLSTIVENALVGLNSFVDSKWQTEAQSWQVVDYSSMGNGFFEQRMVDKVPAGIGDRNALSNLLRSKVSGFLGTAHTPSVELRFAQLKHGQQDRISRSTRLDPKGYCPTLLAGTGTDKGSFQAVRPVHYTVPRVICPREAARLQGFPDWFVFHPTKWHSFRQIGNSVSPIVAEQLLSKISTLF
ncbi:DNA cytosine methyltransferase [Dyadobacter pollutisoli]|uniref:Cytosine-specific methyltransferase n=1 Tax=Dyadobacter pollutisoli TaxID=2910158 RepID=A0A9E8N8C9_9BACT|nr:DNA cytosine methyltransferase [Dyadobacter pollutisoli]WAC11228.1 DNA cytosine methyltransferase [Dyadobacter pollutisoli]